MPPTLTPPIAAPSPDLFRRKQWTRDECRRLVEAGVLEPGRFELIQGDVVFKVRQNPPHVLVVTLVLRALVAIIGFDFVQTQAPVALDDHNEPEPDAAVLACPLREYLGLGTPTPGEVRLVVEIAHATLAADLTAKADLYARFGIGEYWVVDIVERRLSVHRQPSVDGYADVISYDENQSAAPLAAPTSSIRVADLLP